MRRWLKLMKALWAFWRSGQKEKKERRKNMGCCFKAIGDETRREILSILSRSDETAGDIANRFKISQPTVSNHLKTLKEAGLISERKDKQNRIYSLNREELRNVISTLEQIAQGS